jgi:hypothetical protein
LDERKEITQGAKGVEWPSSSYKFKQENILKEAQAQIKESTEYSRARNTIEQRDG